MSTQETSTAAMPAVRWQEDGFGRVVCGVDGRRLGFAAVRQAARLTSPAGRLTLVGVVETFAALSGRWGDEPARRRLEASERHTTDECVAELTERVRASLAWAEMQVEGPAELLSRVVRGEVYEGLLDAARDEEADLVAVGAHGGRRLVGAALADAAAIVLHDAPCSVLVARHGFDPGRFPCRVVVGVDGLPESQAALAAAAGIRRRAGGHAHRGHGRPPPGGGGRRARRLRGAPRSRRDPQPSRRGARDGGPHGRPDRGGVAGAARPARARQRERARRVPGGVVRPGRPAWRALGGAASPHPARRDPPMARAASGGRLRSTAASGAAQVHGGPS